MNNTVKLCSLAVSLMLSVGVFAQPARKLVPAFRSLGAESNLTASVSLADANGDGFLDIFFAEGRHWPQQNLIFINNGKGVFNVVRRLGEEMATSYAIRAADFDNDGDLDVVVGNDRVRKPIFWNDGKGNFTMGPTIGVDTANTRNITVTVADLNGNQRADIIVVNRNEVNTIHFNKGKSFTAGIPIGAGQDATIQIVAADLDGDGDLDLALANRQGQENEVYWNDGSGKFSDSSPYGSRNDRTRAVTAADFNGDGRTDLATGNIQQPNGIFFNRGGKFVAGDTFGKETDATYALTAVDLDNDGDMDLIAGNVEAQNALYFNNGKGQFVEQRFGADDTATYGIAAGDVDGDSFVDVVVANSGAPNLLFYNRPR